MAPGSADCPAAAHPFLKHAKKEIQVQPSCLCLVRCVVKGRQCLSAEGWAVCVCLLSWWPFPEHPSGFDQAAKSSYLPCSDAAVGMVTCSVCFLDGLLFPA